MPLGPNTKRFFDQLKDLSVNNEKAFFELSQEEGVKQARDVDAKGFAEIANPFPLGVEEKDFSRHEITLADGFIMPIHIYKPSSQKKSLPTMIYFYGGGFCLNMVEFQKAPCAKIALIAECQVILIEYPLAPQHDAAFIVDSCYETAVYLYEHADEYEIDQQHFIIAGCSSGGTIAAAIVNRTLKQQDFCVSQQVLISPFLDSSLETHRNTAFTDYQNEDVLLQDKALEFFVRTYAPADTDLHDPLVSPIYNNDWQGFPDTLIVAGEYDGLRGESEAYSAKLNEAGIQNVELDIFEGQTHNFFSGRKVLNDGQDPAERIAEFVKAGYA